MDGSILVWLTCSVCLSFEHALNRVAIAIENISFFIFLKFYTKVIIEDKIEPSRLCFFVGHKSFFCDIV